MYPVKQLASYAPPEAPLDWLELMAGLQPHEEAELMRHPRWVAGRGSWVMG